MLLYLDFTFCFTCIVRKRDFKQIWYRMYQADYCLKHFKLVYLLLYEKKGGGGNYHCSFINSSGMTKLGFCKFRCAPISQKFLCSWSRAPRKKLSTSCQTDSRCNDALHRLVDSVKEQGMYLEIYDVESFLDALDQLNGNVIVIGAHQDLQKPNFVIPEILTLSVLGGGAILPP